MSRWKVAGGVALSAAIAVAVLAWMAPVRGQEPATPRHETLLRITDGAQIGVTVQNAEGAAGVTVERVRENGPAARAGVREGDVIVEFDGERVRSARQFSRLVDETPHGRPVKMAVQRGGQRVSVDITPEPGSAGWRVRPAPFEFRMPELPHIPDTSRLREYEIRPEIEIFASRPPRLGVQLEDVDDQLAEYFGVKRGALVTTVEKDSPAGRAGLKAGDVITKIAGEPVDDIRDVRREVGRVDEGKEFAIEVMRERKPLSLKAKIDPPAPRKERGTTT